MQTELVTYTPLLHDRLQDYMQYVYPYRDIRYLEWWLSNIDSGDEEDWAKCYLVMEGDDVIGCTSANPVELLWKNERYKFSFIGNTIISTEKRGLGISKSLYNTVNLYSNWLSVGITDIAWKIQPKYVKNFTPISPVRIYITANINVLGQLFKRLFKSNGKGEKHFVMPEQIKVRNNAFFVKVNDVGRIDVPQSGRWTGDKVELIRDKEYLNKRFFDIYCADRYGVYKFEKDGKLEGYIVLRKMYYAGFDMVSVVDYRFMDCHDERQAFAAANKLAKTNNIGFVFGMSSRKYGFIGFPFLVIMPKKLNCAVGTKEIDFGDMLVTSADSDLDFVYYN